MQEMTSIERVRNVLDRQPVDQVPALDSIWGETATKWRQEGKLGQDEDVREHFAMDLRLMWAFNNMADLDFSVQVLEENDETVLQKNGNYATLRRHKQHSTTPEHVDFDVKDFASWNRLIRPHLTGLDRRRINFEGYRKEKQAAAAANRFFCWSGIAPFECMHPVCGHEHMLVGMALEPEWVADMVKVYSEMTLRHLEVLFAEEGQPDGIWFYEDLGFKEKPFMSPAMFRELMLPGYVRLFDWVHARGMKVIVHSCGFVEPLVPALIEAGMDCLQAMEVKAGMDMPRLASQFGDRIAFCGNIDVRTLTANNRAAIDAELERKMRPVLQAGGGYILHSDHSIPPDVEHDTLQYFFDHGRQLSRKIFAGK